VAEVHEVDSEEDAEVLAEADQAGLEEDVQVVLVGDPAEVLAEEGLADLAGVETAEDLQQVGALTEAKQEDHISRLQD
jgi:hypothetical protein